MLITSNSSRNSTSKKPCFYTPHYTPPMSPHEISSAKSLSSNANSNSVFPSGPEQLDHEKNFVSDAAALANTAHSRKVLTDMVFPEQSEVISPFPTPAEVIPLRKAVGMVATAVQNLYCWKDRRYYGRFKISGQTRWVSLKTTVFATAKLRLADEMKTISGMREIGVDANALSFDFAKLNEIYTRRYLADSEISDKTKLGRTHAIKRVQNTWPQFMAMKPNKVTAVMIAEWANRTRTEATFQRHGAKTVHRGYSADCVNQSLSAISRLFEIAVEYGVLLRNPMKCAPSHLRLRFSVRSAKPILPSSAKMRELLEELEKPVVVAPEFSEFEASIRFLVDRDRLDVGEFARFLAYSGARLAEAGRMDWDFIKERTLRISGTKTETSEREIPQIPRMTQLLADIRARRVREGVVKDAAKLSGPIFRVKECQKSIDRACKALGIARLTHHDFRHYFAT
ncbi:MAG: site-specific integrase, partial [bacterium]|nr:site-specific integrase [bacterium]